MTFITLGKDGKWGRAETSVSPFFLDGITVLPRPFPNEKGDQMPALEEYLSERGEERIRSLSRIYSRMSLSLDLLVEAQRLVLKEMGTEMSEPVRTELNFLSRDLHASILALMKGRYEY
jgi:hypothetical protein